MKGKISVQSYYYARKVRDVWIGCIRFEHQAKVRHNQQVDAIVPDFEQKFLVRYCTPKTYPTQEEAFDAIKRMFPEPVEWEVGQ